MRSSRGAAGAVIRAGWNEKMRRMPLSVERLRWFLLALAILLVVCVIAVLGYARWRVRRAVRDLPAKLGISIERSTNGFDISKSEGGRTIFTLHAAKMIQYTGRGMAALRDVSITLYDPNGLPADRIYGDKFAYDPGESVVRAQGEVQIDLWATAGDRTTGGRTAVEKTAGTAAAQSTRASAAPRAAPLAAAGSGNSRLASPAVSQRPSRVMPISWTSYLLWSMAR